MRILIVTQFYLPEALITLEPELAESLQAMGHEVAVLTGFPNYPEGKLYPGYRVKHWQRETIGGVPIIRVPLYPNHGRSSLKRVLNYLSFATSAAVLGPWLSGPVDLVHAIQPLPAAWAGWAISRMRRVPFTMEVQDPWPEALSSTGMVASSWVLRAVGASARFVYRRAAAIRTISNGYKANLVQKGAPAERVHVISNWIDPHAQRPVAYDAALAEQLGLHGRFNVMYAGTIGLPQKLETVLAAAAMLADVPKVQFVMVGGGQDEERLKAAVASRGLPNVKFLGYHSVDAMPRLYALADVLMMHLARDPVYAITIPSKLFAYLSAGRPVLSAVEGEVSDLVRSLDVGLACPPEDPAALAAVVRQFHAMPPEELDAMGARSRRAAVEVFGRERLVKKMEAMLTSTVERRSPKKTASDRRK